MPNRKPYSHPPSNLSTSNYPPRPPSPPPPPRVTTAAMTSTNHESKNQGSRSRALSNTEQNWCRAVASGTGITVLALQMSKPPPQIAAAFPDILHKLQTRHPLLAAKLHYNPTTKAFSFINPIPPPPHMTVKFNNRPVTAELLSGAESPLHSILDHELNTNIWSDPSTFPCSGIEVFHVTVYAASETQSVVVLRFHTAICDRTTATSLLRELMEMLAGTEKVIENEGEGKMGIENLIPVGATRKTLWAHGVDMLGYSVKSLRLTNLSFVNTKLPRRSEVVRLQVPAKYTTMILEGCKSRGIKVCGLLAAAAIIAAHSSTKLHINTNSADAKKYGLVTLIDCRSLLQPPLSPHHYGFYHSVILNIHKVKGGEKVWDLAKSCYMDFTDYKKCRKHFSDMADLNFLMSKAIENPSLTASSSLRTSLITVFEDPVLDDSFPVQREIGVDDYVGCASIHGVGPSLAFFDTVRDGRLDCACVYPAPLHSRDQVAKLVERVTRVLIDAVVLE